MDRTFRQRRGLLTIEAEITEDGVRYCERSPFRAAEFKVGFAEIDTEAVRVYNVARVSLIICIFFAMSFLLRAYRVFVAHDAPPVTLVYAGLLLVLPVVGTWMYSARYVGIRTNLGALLFFERRGAGDPGAFLDRIREARGEYLRGNFPHLLGGSESRARTRTIGFTARPDADHGEQDSTGTN